MTQDEASRYQLGDLLLDRGSRQLLRGGEPLDLGALTFDLLVALVEAAPNVVSYDTLAERVWPARSASLETISQRASMLRKALGDSAAQPRYFEVVRGQGLRLVIESARISGIPAEGEAVESRELSLAVLPFSDLSEDADQQYFADGLVEDITTDLAQIPHLFVVSRKSSFTYRDSTEDLVAIGAGLGVSHLLSGSVRRRGAKLRVNARLVDAADGANVWSRRFDRDSGNLFAIQDDLTEEIVTALDVELVSGENGRMRRSKLNSQESRDALYRGIYQYYKYERTANGKARRHFQRVIELEPEAVPGYTWMLQTWAFAIAVRWDPPDVAVQKLGEYVAKSLAIDSDDPNALVGKAVFNAIIGDLDTASAAAARAAAVAPYLDDAHFTRGWVLNLNGQPEAAIPCLESAVRLCPVQAATQFGVLATAYRNVGRYEESIDVFLRCLQRYPDFVFAYTGLAVSHGMMDNWEEARRAVEKVRAMEPAYTIEDFTTPNFYRDKTVMNACAKVLLKAGLPEH